MNDDFLKKHQVRPDAEFVENLYQKLEESDQKSAGSFFNFSWLRLRPKTASALVLIGLATLTFAFSPDAREAVVAFLLPMNNFLVKNDATVEPIAVGNPTVNSDAENEPINTELFENEQSEIQSISNETSEFVGPDDGFELIPYDSIEQRFPEVIFPTNIPEGYELTGGGALVLDEDNIAAVWFKGDDGFITVDFRVNSVQEDYAPYVDRTFAAESASDGIYVTGVLNGVVYALNTDDLTLPEEVLLDMIPREVHAAPPFDESTLISIEEEGSLSSYEPEIEIFQVVPSAGRANILDVSWKFIGDGSYSLFWTPVDELVVIQDGVENEGQIQVELPENAQEVVPITLFVTGDDGGRVQQIIEVPTRLTNDSQQAPFGKINFELGGQTNSLVNAPLMTESGMSWVKFQHKWSCGNNPADLLAQIDEAHASGFKVLYSVVGTPYPNSIDFDCYTNFLSGVAELGADGIEVWSQMNIDFQWPAGAVDPEAYVRNMLQPAYIKIKDANPNTLVISGAPAPTGFFGGSCTGQGCDDDAFIREMAAAGAADYLDCVGVHYNAGATSPSDTSGHPADGGAGHHSWYFQPMIDVYTDALQAPLCFTELGYLSGEDYGGVPGRFSWASNTTVEQHADWLAEAVKIGADSGKVRMITVFNVDFELYSEDPQAGFALVRQDGSCPACETLGEVMGDR